MVVSSMTEKLTKQRIPLLVHTSNTHLQKNMVILHVFCQGNLNSVDPSKPPLGMRRHTRQIGG